MYHILIGSWGPHMETLREVEDRELWINFPHDMDRGRGWRQGQGAGRLFLPPPSPVAIPILGGQTEQAL